MKTIARQAIQLFCSQLLVKSGPNARHVITDACKCGPIGWLIGRQAAIYGIDSEGKEAIKLGVKAL